VKIPQTHNTYAHDKRVYKFYTPWEYLMALCHADPFANSLPVWFEQAGVTVMTEEQKRIAFWLHGFLGHITGTYPVAKLPELLSRFDKFDHLPEGSY
jgi:hypothetical protein